jgi:hypothetical protein
VALGSLARAPRGRRLTWGLSSDRPDVPLEESLGTLLELQAAGKVRNDPGWFEEDLQALEVELSDVEVDRLTAGGPAS